VRRLILARHGQTQNNVDRRFTGWADVPLNAIGRAESRALGRRLRALPIDQAYSSDLRRAAETARLALGDRELAIAQTPALREANFGAWQGLTYDEAQARSPGEFTNLLSRREDFRPPGGETILEVRDRVIAFLDEARAIHADQTVLLVASGGPLQILLSALFSLPLGEHWRLGMGNCSVSIVDFVQGEPLLTLLNDRGHVRSRQPRSASHPPSAASHQPSSAYT
jgi:broad specificity phosphatase PhoE